MQDLEQTSTIPTFTMTLIEPSSLIDDATIEAYNDYRKETLIGVNKSLFNNSKIHILNGYYFALCSFTEDKMKFCTLHPFLINHRAYKKRAFAFGAINSESNELFLFFNGAKEDDRTRAIQIYNELKNAYKDCMPQLTIFAIKL